MKTIEANASRSDQFDVSVEREEIKKYGNVNVERFVNIKHRGCSVLGVVEVSLETFSCDGPARRSVC